MSHRHVTPCKRFIGCCFLANEDGVIHIRKIQWKGPLLYVTYRAHFIGCLTDEEEEDKMVSAWCGVEMFVAGSSMRLSSLALPLEALLSCRLLLLSPFGPVSFWRLFSFFHFIRRFWNQIFIWRSVSARACAISMRRLLVR